MDANPGPAQNGKRVRTFGYGLCALVWFSLCAGASERSPEDLKSLLADLVSPNAEKSQKAEKALVKLPKAADALLVAELSNERDLDRAGRLARLLSKRGYRFEQFGELPVVLREELKKLCGKLAKAGKRDKLREAINKLQRYGGAAAPFLVPVIRAAHVPTTPHVNTACALAAMRRDEGLPILIRSLENDDLAIKTRDFILALGPVAIEALLKNGATSPHAVIRRRSTDLIGWMSARKPDPRIQKVFVQGIRHRNAQVALASLVALINLSGPKVFDALLAELSAGRINDRFKLHCSAVGLARTATPGQLPALLRLCASRNVSIQEVAVTALGLCEHRTTKTGPVAKQIDMTLQRFLSHGSTRIQKRAAEALGARIARGAVPSESIPELARLTRRGRTETRYAAALALGAAVSRNTKLPDEVLARCREILGVKEVEGAKNSCSEALMSVFEVSAAQRSAPGLNSLKGPKPKPPPVSQPKDAGEKPGRSPREEQEAARPDAPGGEESEDDDDGKTSGYYKPGFDWGGRSKPPITESKPPDAPEVEDAPSETGEQSPSTPVIQQIPAAEPQKDDGPEETDKPEPKEVREETAHASGSGNRHGKVPPGLPHQRRHRLETIDNPAHSGQAVFAGYLRVN